MECPCCGSKHFLTLFYAPNENIYLFKNLLDIKLEAFSKALFSLADAALQPATVTMLICHTLVVWSKLCSGILVLSKPIFLVCSNGFSCP